MRPRNPLLLLALACLLGPTAALAATRCSGLQCSSLGSSVVSSSSDGRALHVALAGDGSDGASVSLSNLDGVTLTCSQPWPVASSSSLSFVFSSSSEPMQRLHLERSSGSLVVTQDASGQCSDGTCSSLYRLCYSTNGGLVWTEQVSSSSSFTLLDGPGGTPAIPSVSLELDQTHGRMLSVLSFSSSVLYLAGGAPLEVSRVVTVVEDPGLLEQSLDHVDIQCPSPGGMTSLDFSSLYVIRDGYSIPSLSLDLDGHPDVLSFTGTATTSSITTRPTWADRVWGNGACDPGFHRCDPGSSLDESCSPSSLELSPLHALVWTPVADEGSSLLFTIQARDTYGNAIQPASLECRMQGAAMMLDASISGLPPDSARVLSHGAEVGRVALSCSPVSCSVVVSPPPGGSPEMAMTSCGANHAGYDVKANKKVVVVPGDRRENSLSSELTCSDLGLHATFADQRLFVFGGVSMTGDEIQFKPACPAPSSEVITVVGSNFALQRVSSSPPSNLAFDVTRFSSTHKDQVALSLVGPPALSSTNPVVDVALDLERFSSHVAARGVSATVTLSSNLVLTTDTEYDLFSRFGETQHFRTADGGNQFTFDTAILGPGCGPTGSGRFLTLQVQRAPGAPDGLGTVTVTHTDLAACDGSPLPCDAGSRATIVLDASTVCAASTVSAHTQKTGNDGDGTTKIVLDWTLSSTCTTPGASVELYRAPYGAYPTYQGGSTAALPTSYPPPAPWSRVALQCSSGAAGTVSQCTDETSSRDCYTFSLVVTDRFGNRSPFIQTSQCALNYERGDVTNGFAQCAGDNLVNTADISDLGGSYGQPIPVGSPLECLDVAPAVCASIECRPTPDHKLNFFDLIAYAINYSLVSTPEGSPRPMAVAANALALDVPRIPPVGQSFDVALRMSGAGDVQGLSTALGFDPAVVEQLGTSRGELLGRQGRDAIVLSSGPGDVDAALLGAGAGIAGEGELARVTFRVKAAGDPAFSIGTVVARDFQNRDVTIAGGAPAPGAGRTALRLAFPNPFERSTTVVFDLRETGPAEVGIYDVAGRHVRTLLRGVQPPGEHTLAWDGRDDGGNLLNAGVYLLRLDAGGHRETRTLRLVK